MSGASRVARGLLMEGMKATAIHGDKTQQERMAALESFKKGEIDVLVATDVAARGLDISDLPCVINYDLPYNAEDYVHRIGRTGRAGASGDAISIYSDKDERLLTDIEKLIKQNITRGQLEGFAPATFHGDERHGDRRRNRTESDARNARGGERERRAPSGSGPGPLPRREKVDPWFLKPYEPSRSTNAVAQPPAPVSKPKPKVAALLGGLPKS
jgi:superfamily II DNA/RNA helicase